MEIALVNHEVTGLLNTVYGVDRNRFFQFYCTPINNQVAGITITNLVSAFHYMVPIIPALIVQRAIFPR